MGEREWRRGEEERRKNGSGVGAGRDELEDFAVCPSFAMFYKE
jgi:hypothetical protein